MSAADEVRQIGQRFIAHEWASYRERVIHPDAGPTQVRETQMAFYAGAGRVMAAMICVAEDDVSEEDGAAILSGIKVELDAFLAEAKAIADAQART